MDAEIVRKRQRVVSGVPERDLVAAILERAADDCKEGAEADAVDAYRWIAHLDPMFCRYCEIVDIDPEVFRSIVISKSGLRCEQMLERIRWLANEARLAA